VSLRDTASVRQTARAALNGRERVVLAISGGLDSMALLDAAAHAVPRDRLIVATFDHGTGQAATAARALVEQRASVLGVKCVSDAAADIGTSEAELRDARWAFLRNVAATHSADIATAHTEDDQIETVLMRIMRDTGARGLAGLYAKSEILRPFLGLRRRILVQYARAQGLTWLEDPSNMSSAYFRNRVRHDLLPALRKVRPAIEDQLLTWSRRAADARRKTEALVDDIEGIRVRVQSDGLDVPVSAFHGRSSDARLLWPAIAARVGLMLDRRGLARAAEFTINGRVGSRIQFAGGWELVRSRDALQLRPSNRLNNEKATAELSALSDGTTWGDWSFRSEAIADDSWSAWLPSDRGLSVRPWQAGDAMFCREGGSARKVKRLLSEAGVTGHQRAGWPVVLAGDQIVWIPGVRRGAAATARSGRPGLPFVCEYIHR
jgi:tRNA(Ile)-lysidine synthase